MAFSVSSPPSSGSRLAFKRRLEVEFSFLENSAMPILSLDASAALRPKRSPLPHLFLTAVGDDAEDENAAITRRILAARAAEAAPKSSGGLDFTAQVDQLLSMLDTIKAEVVSEQTEEPASGPSKEKRPNSAGAQRRPPLPVSTAEPLEQAQSFSRRRRREVSGASGVAPDSPVSRSLTRSVASAAALSAASLPQEPNPPSGPQVTPRRTASQAGAPIRRPPVSYGEVSVTLPESISTEQLSKMPSQISAGLALRPKMRRTSSQVLTELSQRCASRTARFRSEADARAGQAMRKALSLERERVLRPERRLEAELVEMRRALGTARARCWSVVLVYATVVQSIRHILDHQKEESERRATAAAAIRKFILPYAIAYVARKKASMVAEISLEEQSEQAIGPLVNLLRAVAYFRTKQKVLFGVKVFSRRLRCLQRYVRQHRDMRQTQLYALRLLWEKVAQKLRQSLCCPSPSPDPIAGRPRPVVPGSPAVTRPTSAPSAPKTSPREPSGSGSGSVSRPSSARSQQGLYSGRLPMERGRGRVSAVRQLQERFGVSAALSQWLLKHGEGIPGGGPGEGPAVPPQRPPVSLEAPRPLECSLQIKKRVLWANFLTRHETFKRALRQWKLSQEVAKVTQEVLCSSPKAQDVAALGKPAIGALVGVKASLKVTPEEGSGTSARSTGRRSTARSRTKQTVPPPSTGPRRPVFRWILSEKEMAEIVCRHFEVPLHLYPST
eukprot:RCo000935